MHALITAKRSAIANICRRHQVAQLNVVGSAARGVDFDPERSDAGFLVKFAPGAQADICGWFSIQTELERLLGGGVDLVEYPAVSNPYVRADSERTRELVNAA